MNAPRDPWAAFCAEFHEELVAAQSWTPEMMEAARLAHEREEAQKKEQGNEH